MPRGPLDILKKVSGMHAQVVTKPSLATSGQLTNRCGSLAQAIVDFLPNIIQAYQYISCVYCISVYLYSFENHILVMTQQFLVLHKRVQQQVKAAYLKSMLVVTATS